jgi:LysM repeat protein
MSRLVLLAGALVIAAIALFMLPALLGVGGGGASSSASPTGSGRGPVATSSAEPLTSAAPTQQVYIVKSGDTMSKIAAKFGLKPEDLCAANSATIKNCDKIALGQQIIIPAPGSGGVVTPSGSAAP